MNKVTLHRFLLLAAIPMSMAVTAVNAQDSMNPPVEHKEMGSQSSQPGSDTWITTKVKADLLATEDVSGLDLKVETVNGVVSLSGAVSSQAEKDRAVAVAKGIKGVTRVDASGIRVMAARPTR